MLKKFEQLGDQLVKKQKAKWRDDYILELYAGDQLYGVNAIMHGNEVAGLACFVEFLKLVVAGVVRPQNSLLLSLGNIEAYGIGERFVDKDLNRCFNTQGTTSAHGRARVLEKAYADVMKVVDIHQTQKAAVSSFFVSPYSEAALVWANQLDPKKRCVVLGKKATPTTFSQYFHAKNIPAVTVELGEKGLDYQQVHHGLYLLLQVALEKSAGKLPEELYVSDVVLTLEDEWELCHSHQNFAYVNKGDDLAFRGEEILPADSSGYLLFPKFRSLDRVDPGDPVGRLLKKVKTSEYL